MLVCFFVWILVQKGSPVRSCSFLIVLERGERGDELVVADHVVLVLVQAGPEQAQALVAGVRVCGAQEVAHVVERDVAFVLFVDCLERCVELDRRFTDDALSNQLDRYLALDEAPEEAFEEFAGLPLEVLLGVGLSPVEATSCVDQNGVVRLTRHEAVANF